MTADDLKESLLSTARRIGERIQDTPAWAQFKDRFDGWSPAMQRLAVLSIVLAAFLIVLMLPWSWYGESQEVVDTFEERRNVIRELLKVSREAGDVPDIPMAPPVDSMRADLQARLKEASLIEDQIKGIDASSSSSRLIPADKTESGLQISLWKLNVRQVVQVGTMLSRLSPSVKLTDIEMQANKEDARYFDVIFRLVSLAVPDLSAPPAEPEPANSNNRRARGNQGAGG